MIKFFLGLDITMFILLFLALFAIAGFLVFSFIEYMGEEDDLWG